MTPVIQSGLTLLDYGVKWGTGTLNGVQFYEGLTYSYAALYRTQPNVRTCVDFLARNVAQLGLHVYRRVSNTDRVRLTAKDHELARLIERPNPWTTTYRIIEALMSDLAIYWNHYWLKVEDEVAGLKVIRIPPEIITPLGTGNAPSAYQVNFADGIKTYAPDEIVHFRGYNPDDARMGLSPLETLRRVLAEEQAMGDYRENFWKNSARMNGLIERPKDAPPWNADIRKRFMEEWKAAYSGMANSGQTGLLEDGMTWKQMSFNAQESEYLGGRKLTREECARAYHIPLPMVGILDHATFCLPGHVPVFTSAGPKPIAQVQAGDQVWSHTGDGFGLMRVTRSGQTGVDPILRIKTQNRILEANPTHPVLVRRLVKVQGVADPNASAKVRAGQSRWHYEAQHVYVAAKNIRHGDVLVALKELPDGAPRYSLSLMEIFGLLLGDGNIYPDSGMVSIARANDAPYMDHYREVMREEFVSFGSRGNGRVREGVPTQPVTLVEGDRQTRFVSVLVAEWLAELGLSGTSHTKRVPGWVFGTSRAERLAFLRGYLDSDGSVDKRGKIAYSSCNRDLLEDIRYLCMSLGIAVSNAYHRVGLTVLPNGQVGDVDQWTITCSDPAANRMIGSHNSCHQKRLDAGRGWNRKGKGYPFAKGRRSEPPAGCEYSRVVEVEELPAEPVYDIEVEGTHNFVAAGLVVHNSNIKEQHRHLYQDCLGPWLRMIEEDIELQVLSDMSDREDVYCEFNIQEKLGGSFEEQMTALNSAIQRPYMTPNEGRAKLNLPAIEGGDSLGMPLNMAGADTGYSTDTEGNTEPKRDAEVEFKASGRIDPTRMQLRKRYASKWAEVLSKYFKRQGQSIRSRAGDGNVDPVAMWADKGRWKKELQEELFKLGIETAWAWASYVAAIVEADIAQEPMEAYVMASSERTAGNITDATERDTVKALNEEDPKGALSQVFETLATVTAVSVGAGMVTQMANFGSHEGARQGGLKTKTWQVNSVNPRPDHAALNGTTVNLDDIFYQTGQRWPGDPAGGAENNANCECSVVFGK